MFEMQHTDHKQQMTIIHILASQNSSYNAFRIYDNSNCYILDSLLICDYKLTQQCKVLSLREHIMQICELELKCLERKTTWQDNYR